MNSPTRAKPLFWPSLVALGIGLLWYPMFLAPIGPLTNGGVSGLSSLVIAAALAWSGFFLNRPFPIARWTIVLPIAALITYAMFSDALAQYQLHILRREWRL